VQIGVERSGLVEARHSVTVAAVDSSGKVLETFGTDLDRRFFFRSAIKPFQASVSQRLGADLAPERLAIASASHGGQPVHLAHVTEMLREVGLGEENLACPPSWPMSPSAMRRAGAAGWASPRRLAHNCSGKHAAMLRACAALEWSFHYTDSAHPLQKEIASCLAETTREDVGPVGVDGCGVPTFGGTVIGLATAYAALASDPRLSEVARAVSRFSALTADGDREETQLARWIPAAVKGGAMGCLGLAHFSGVGIAAKAWTGALPAAVIAVIEMLRRLGLLPAHPEQALAEVARPPVLGGARRVGTTRPLEDAE
jgi:L-asparaginase II